MPRTGFEGAAGASVAAATKIVAASDSIDTDRADYVCDGTDDESEINSAISDLSSKGGTIFLLEGTYNIGSGDIALSSANTRIVGSGQGTIINFGGNAINFYVTGNYSSIENMLIQGSTNAKGNVEVGGADYFTLSNVIIKDNAAGCRYGVLVDTGCTNFLMKNSIIQDFDGSGDAGLRAYSGGSPSSPLRISNCYIDTCDEGLVLETVTFIVSNSTFTGCEQWAIEWGSNPGLVSGCFFNHSNDQAINISSSGGEATVIVGNVFNGGPTGDAINGIGGGVFFASNLLYNSDVSLTGTGWASTAIILSNHFDPDSGITAADGEPLHVQGNTGLAPTQEKELKYMKNTSGGTLAAGDVVVLKAVAAGDEVTTTTSGGDDMVFGIALEAISDTNYGHIQVGGKTTLLKVDGTTDIAIGDHLSTFTTAGIAQKASSGEIAFAIALEAYATNDSNGVIDALLITPRQV